MPPMIRKQIYLGQQQQALVRRLAKARRVSESELIRQAIDQQVAPEIVQPWPADPGAWERARNFRLALQARGPVSGQARTWKREEAYAERESRPGG